jgi:hypothetical protein
MSANQSFQFGAARFGAVMALAASIAGCGVDKQTGPSFSGPAEQALALSLAASPSILRLDGVSRSTITLTARDEQGAPVAGRRFFLTAVLDPADPAVPDAPGDLSVEEVVTGSNGQASFEFVAPDNTVEFTEARVSVTPFEEDFGSTPGRSVRIAFVSNGVAPTATFTFSPSAPAQFETVTFDASGTTVSGAACGSACKYRWEFGGEGTAEGQAVTYQFQNEGFYTVKLTVDSLQHNTTKTFSRRIQVGPAH